MCQRIRSNVTCIPCWHEHIPLSFYTTLSYALYSQKVDLSTNYTLQWDLCERGGTNGRDQISEFLNEPIWNCMRRLTMYMYSQSMRARLREAIGAATLT